MKTEPETQWLIELNMFIKAYWNAPMKNRNLTDSATKLIKQADIVGNFSSMFIKACWNAPSGKQKSDSTTKLIKQVDIVGILSSVLVANPCHI